ncbi:hypothetical protein [Aeromonas diversa]|uniref:hypothetical protein n=1 Tax=Aeromonas diversa TaxID=502790 RepID=UPI003462CA2D
MSHRDAILRIANELAERGTTPTTAMVKARLGEPVPMAELMSVLASWKQGQTAAPPHPEPAQRPAESLEARLDRIEAKLDTLITLLQSR